MHSHYRKIWGMRLNYIQQDIEAMQKTLNIRSLVINKAQETDIYIKFADLCLSSNNSS